jgi:hypothetical protein
MVLFVYVLPLVVCSLFVSLFVFRCGSEVLFDASPLSAEFLGQFVFAEEEGGLEAVSPVGFESPVLSKRAGRTEGRGQTGRSRGPQEEAGTAPAALDPAYPYGTPGGV